MRVRVVSMPSWELFDDQDRSYRESVLPRSVKARVSVEQASDFGWSKYTGCDGHNFCIETFGASAPLKHLLKKFGFSMENIVVLRRSRLRSTKRDPSPVTFEILNRSLVRLGCFAGSESPKIAPFARLGILLA